MIKTFLCFLMLVFYVNANSLYTDDVTDVIASPTDQLDQKDYDYSSDTTTLEQTLSKSLDLYMNNIFKLSQLTPDLATITNESLVYSDINRLEQISNQLIRILDKKNLNFLLTHLLRLVNSKLRIKKQCLNFMQSPLTFLIYSLIIKKKQIIILIILIGLQHNFQTQ